jgi:hypothetical protein
MIKEKETPDNNIMVEEIKSKILVQNQAYINIFLKLYLTAYLRTTRTTIIYNLS